jgi:hypothetical protein
MSAAKPKPVRMVQCVYDHKGEWAPLGKARTRCPRCGSTLSSKLCKVELREP